MKLAWTNTAIRDLAHIRRSIAHDNPTAARAVASRILDAVAKLRRHPEMGRIGRLAGMRELVAVTVPALPGLVTEGDTFEEAKVMVRRGHRWLPGIAPQAR